MKNTLLIISVALASLLSITAIFLPTILHLMGLHPSYRGEWHTFDGKRALIVTTSHATLGDTGNATGVYASEMTIPYYAFQGSGIQVDIASIKGGEIPIEPMSMRYPLITSYDRRFKRDTHFRDKVKNSIPINEIDITQYDLLYFAGGWGASYDFAYSAVLGEIVTQAYEQGIIIGAVCHGPLAFIQAKTPTGEPLVKGKRMTAVTNKQAEELGITATPMHPETELRRLGAEFESNTAFRDFFATHTVTDGTIVTGQNQNSSAETAHSMMKLLISVQ